MALTDALQVSLVAYPAIFAVMVVFYLLVKLLGGLFPAGK